MNKIITKNTYVGGLLAFALLLLLASHLVNVSMKKDIENVNQQLIQYNEKCSQALQGQDIFMEMEVLK